MKHLGTLCVLLLCVVVGCATLNRDPTDDYSALQLQQMGSKLLAARDFGQALKYLSQAEKKRPNDATIQYDLGLAYYERGLKIDALAHLKKALVLKPDYAEVENALGRFYAEDGQLDLAQQCFQRAINNPFYQTPQLALYNLGLVYEKKSDPEMALKQYQEAVRLQRNYGAAYYHMGQLLEQLRRADEAREAYSNAIEFSPDLVEAHYRYGVMSYTAGELENALYSLNRVVKLAPRSSMAEDARRYLERMQTIIPAGPTSRPSQTQFSERVLQLDVMTNQDLLNERVEAAVRPAAGDPGVNTGHQQEPKTAADVQASASEPPLKERPDAPPVDGPRTYIVQMGSFLDKDNAEELQQRLRRKGYDAVLKPYHHQVLGQLYVVQLKPVNDPEKASQLMMQVEKEGHGKAIIIETPAK
jgi:tetratricopeptide (TPR) repeat protein